MSRIIFVIGPQGSGKSTFIQLKYAVKELFYVFDLYREGRRMFGKWDRENDDHLIAIYNELTGEAMEYLWRERPLWWSSVLVHSMILK